MTCAQTGSYNDPNRPWRTEPGPTIHPQRPKIPCHQWTWVLPKKKEPTNTKFNPPVFANSAFDEGCLV